MSVRSVTRILIVEADEHLRRLMGLTLRLAGFSTSEARDGMEALALLDRLRPDGVVLDVVLPGLDGIALLQEMGAHAGTARIPVIIVTASMQPLDGVRADCVLRKPIAPADLLTAVEKCLPGA